jgi:hypothetical protein
LLQSTLFGFDPVASKLFESTMNLLGATGLAAITLSAPMIAAGAAFDECCDWLRRRLYACFKSQPRVIVSLCDLCRCQDDRQE